MEPVRSPRNQRVAAAVRLHRARERALSGKILLEGPNLLEAAAEAGLTIGPVFALEDDAVTATLAGTARHPGSPGSSVTHHLPTRSRCRSRRSVIDQDFRSELGRVVGSRGSGQCRNADKDGRGLRMWSRLRTGNGRSVESEGIEVGGWGSLQNANGIEPRRRIGPHCERFPNRGLGSS